MVKCPLCGESLNNNSVISNHIQKIHPQRISILNL